MDSLDLDIENYNLEDLMNLFGLHCHFNELDLKRAYKIALQTHPDKSGLPSDIFMFFMEAYKMISRIYYFKHKNIIQQTEYRADVDHAKAKLLHTINKKKKGEFNKWFNEMFDKARIKDDAVDSGYEEWLRHGEVEEHKKIGLYAFGSEFEKLKQKCKALAVHRGISNMEKTEGHTLSRRRPEEYTSSIFSKLAYEDLKKAHTESVVPVTRADFENKQQFQSVDQLQHYRNGQDVEPLSMQQARNYLKTRRQQQEVDDTHRVFDLLQRDKEIEKKNEQWWSHLKQLTNE
tara:strand:- start:917 stop:1783 length:867 start_codon:yes stop_codon:yes gene_type:complete